jgi:molybdopterin-guanine dinucleotide biosynthesis protein A
MASGGLDDRDAGTRSVNFARLTPPIPRTDITGLVLAGGNGRRMGGIDKGLQDLDGAPLVVHALARLAPQVANCRVSANRHLDRYRALGVPVLPDAPAGYGTGPEFAGPLAGLLAGLRSIDTRWLVSVPCDVPGFPPDLVERLAHAAADQGVSIAIASTTAAAAAADAVHSGHHPAWRPHPVFCLLHRDLADDLAAYLHGGERRVMGWIVRHPHAIVRFNDAAAFDNLNTAADLDRARSDAEDPVVGPAMTGRSADEPCA